VQATHLSPDEGQYDSRDPRHPARSVRCGAVVGVTDRNPAESAKPPATIRQPIPATSPDDGAKVIAEAWVRSGTLGLYLSLVVVTGVRRGELCGLQICDVDLGRGPSARRLQLCGPRRSVAGYRPSHLRIDRELTQGGQGRAGRCWRQAAG
jgi:hypothetical protein